MTYSFPLNNALLVLTIVVVLLPAQTYAFGAGDIPDFAYLNDKAFRHGDIENVLETLTKTAAVGGGFMGFMKQVSGGKKFSKSDIKKVYFGNWLRDYSQAMDIAGLSKLTADTLVLVVSVLGFMTFGYSTLEFDVTADRLGVYLPVEHIDNPKGYAEKEGDARQFHPKLRPPVNREELEIDERTGMKKYMASDNQGWDTSTSFIRRTFRACIEHGRRAGGEEGADLWEAYRLMGTGLHTMEDLLAHSNWCEIALRKMGYEDVFCHVGDAVIINTPNGPAPPLVTGTFGGADFLHSLLGEAGDKLSQSSVTDLTQKMNNAQANEGSGNGPNLDVIKTLMSRLGGGGEDTSKAEQIQSESKAYHFNPDNVAPPEVQQRLKELLAWHDDVMRSIEKKIEMIPGLESLVEQLSNALNEYIYTVLAPYIVPILMETTSVLDEGSQTVINNDDQFEVFNNPHAHDPSHSMLSKDHFGLVLNEPAGKIAQIVVRHSVNLIVPAWSNNEDPDQVIDQILEAFHHPYYNTGRSRIQDEMFDEMQRWFGGLGEEGSLVIESLTKESVHEHRNKRQGYTEIEEPGYGGCSHGGSHGGGSSQPNNSLAALSGLAAGYGFGNFGGGKHFFQDVTHYLTV
ncbi:heterokaryon incompatibility Het-C [Panaeolus papilionaceus]|nr:heterokaryon incompatibility Het-C [Panaeolus papilionaceus]